MKIIYLLLSLLIINANLWAVPDTLEIKLKSGIMEKIPISEITNIEFDNINSVNDKQLDIGLNNYPNPFTDFTMIAFELDKPYNNIIINIYDMNGNIVRMLNHYNCNQGKNQIKWDTKNNNGEKVKSGTYFYEVRINGQTKTKKMLLVK